MENHMNYHEKLGKYYLSKCDLEDLHRWKNCSKRVFTECPFHIARTKQPEDVLDLLCDPLYLEMAIQKDLLDLLLLDIDDSLTYTKSPDLKLVRKSLLNGIAAIRNVPKSAIYCLVNRLSQIQQSDLIKPYYDNAVKHLDTRGVWLIAQTDFKETQYINNTVGINAEKNSLYSYGQEHLLLVRSLDTFTIKDIDRVGDENKVISTSIHPMNESIAQLCTDGEVLFGKSKNHCRLKPIGKCFSWFGNGIIGINESGYLSYIDFNKAIDSIIYDKQIEQFSFMAVAKNIQSCILISGDRLPLQTCILVQFSQDLPQCIELEHPGAVISAVSMDQTGRFVLFVTFTKDLILYDILQKKSEVVSYRIVNGIPTQGRIDFCVLSTVGGSQLAAFTTQAGEVITWNVTNNVLLRKGVFKGREEQTYIIGLEISNNNSSLILATNKSISIINAHDNSKITAKSPIVQCALSPDGWLTLANKQGRMVSWYHQGILASTFSNGILAPTAITTFGDGGKIVVGYSNGIVLMLEPDCTPVEDDGVKLFDGSAVVSIVNLDNDRVLVGSYNGEFKVTNFSNQTECIPLKRFTDIHEVLLMRRLNVSGEFMVCGRSNEGHGLFSVQVVRENNTREPVMETKSIIRDVASDHHGNSIYIVLTDKVLLFKRDNNKWQIVGSKTTRASLIHGYPNGVIAITNNNSVNWIELWDDSIEMKTVFTTELPTQPSCMAVSSNQVAIGTADGAHCMFQIRP